MVTDCCFAARMPQDYVKRLPAPKFQEWKDIETQAAGRSLMMLDELTYKWQGK